MAAASAAHTVVVSARPLAHRMVGRVVTNWRGVAAGAMVALTATLSATGTIAGGPGLCPVALLTGTACPGCGLTRAVVALARGDLRGSFIAHPMAAVVVTQALIAPVGFLSARRAGRWSRQWVAATLAATGIAFVAVWLVRLANGTLPPV